MTLLLERSQNQSRRSSVERVQKLWWWTAESQTSLDNRAIWNLGFSVIHGPVVHMILRVIVSKTYHTTGVRKGCTGAYCGLNFVSRKWNQCWGGAGSTGLSPARGNAGYKWRPQSWCCPRRHRWVSAGFPVM